MAYQSLYRRYRSQTFAEIKGQPHVTQALRTAIAEGRHGHAYLFSGPRGTGKTSTARVLAKALNCENLHDGEPCGQCKSCLDIEHGRSFDLHELDAASNNKVDDIRDLIAKVSLGSPGRTKVYILDEVHMLTSGAENALLKTLEEPPPHVVFVLATTEPHKVVPTIRSRTQHFEFHLLPAEELAEHVRWVVQDAGLDVDEAGIDYALRQGGGSARDTLSALDLVAATGGAPTTSDVGLELAQAIGGGDTAAALTAVQRALEGGREPRVIGEETLSLLRDAFLSAMGAPLAHLNDVARTRARDLAGSLGPATITRSLEGLGQALVDMRQAPDPRVSLEVTLLRLTRREGEDLSALLQRIEALEQQVAALVVGGTPSADAHRPGHSTTTKPTPPSARPTPPAPTGPIRRGPADAARDALSDQTSTGQEAPAGEPTAPRSPADNPTSPAPDIDPAMTPDQSEGALTLQQFTALFASGFLEELDQRVRARFRLGHFVAINGGVATFAVPNAHVLPRCEEVRADLERAMAQRFGRSVTVALVVDADQMDPGGRASHSPSAPATNVAGSDEHLEIGEVADLRNADDIASSGVDRLTRAFPGSTLIAPPPD